MPDLLMNSLKFSRRWFLHASAAGALWPLSRPVFGPFQNIEIKTKFDELRANLLQLVNEERSVEKIPALELDDLATRVATAHAEDMATGEFASHWGRNGLKAYQRYSLAGGYHATQENVSAADNTWSMKFEDLKQDTSYLHVRLYRETPPNDGHRRAILAPQHTHVGFGIAVNKLRLRMVELFVAKYVEFQPTKQVAKPQETIELVGKLIRPDVFLNSIEVFYEPLPKIPTLDWLREARGYSLPDESRVLVPKLRPPYIYADKRTGTIDVDITGEFRVPVILYQITPGIYTIVCWVRRNRSEKPFPVTGLCVKAE